MFSILPHTRLNLVTAFIDVGDNYCVCFIVLLVLWADVCSFIDTSVFMNWYWTISTGIFICWCSWSSISQQSIYLTISDSILYWLGDLVLNIARTLKNRAVRYDCVSSIAILKLLMSCVLFYCIGPLYLPCISRSTWIFIIKNHKVRNNANSFCYDGIRSYM